MRRGVDRGTAEVDVKLALARQAGDEAKHFGLIQKRLAELGVDTATFDPGRPRRCSSTCVAGDDGGARGGGQFTREALAVVRNEEFIRFCVSRGDEATAALYATSSSPTSGTTTSSGARCSRSSPWPTRRKRPPARPPRTLELAEELQEIARMKMGISRAPGC